MKKKLKFNDHVKSFPHQIFGDLTIIKSHKEENTYWFIGKEIQNILGFKNMGQVINDADLDNDEIMIVEKKNNIKLFNDFINYYENKDHPLNGQSFKTPVISKYSKTITLIKESGLYGLAMASRKSIAKDFRRAIRKDILPAVRKLFEVMNDVKLRHDILAHLDVEYQKFNSKYFNGLKFSEGGQNGVIFDNWEMSMRHTDKPPAYWKKIGKEKAVELGIPESKIASGLDGMRLIKPEESCSISQHKEYVRFGLNDDKAFALSNSDIAKSHFKLMMDNGVIPNELIRKRI